MDDLERWLRRVCETADGPYLRPFGPNPRWREARVFVVGTNPSTPMRDEFASFDAYWLALTVHTAEFDRVYRSLNTGGMTETTRNTRRLVDAVGSLGFLMTNAAPYPARKPGLIPDPAGMAEIGFQIVDRLIRAIHPRAIVFHGTPSIGLGRRLTGQPLARSVPVSDQHWILRIPGADEVCTVFAIPHLCGAGAPRGYSFDQVFTTLPELLRSLIAA
jgi:hypothetical protein